MFIKVYNNQQVRGALDAYEKTKSFRKASGMTNISKSTIHRWWHSIHSLVHRTKRVQRRKVASRKYKTLVNDLKALFAGDTKLRFTTLQAIQQALDESSYSKQRPSIASIQRCLKLAKVTRRRFTTTKVQPKEDHDMVAKYLEFTGLRSIYKDEEIVCVDETGFVNIGSTCYGYFNRGQIPEYNKDKKRMKVSVAMAICPHKVVAVQTQKEPLKTDTFVAGQMLKNQRNQHS